MNTTFRTLADSRFGGAAKKVSRVRAATILRSIIYLHLLAILIIVSVILMEVADRNSGAAPTLSVDIRFLVNLLSFFSLLALVACPLTSLLVCRHYFRTLTQREIWFALSVTVGLIWFQVVWIFLPCSGNAGGARQRQIRKMETRNIQREIDNNQGSARR